jgi:hypothetical protein
LGVDAGTPTDGRVLLEALGDAVPSWDPVEHTREFSARGRDWRQTLTLEQVGTAAYLSRGSVEPA